MNDQIISRRPVGDTLTMIGRSLRLSRRNLDALLPAVLLPVLLMALFVYVFGSAIHTGTTYINYVVPGIILLCAGFGSATTAVSVCADMVGGIMDRFQSLPIASSAVLTGHVAASMARNLLSGALVAGTALLMGFRPTPARSPGWRRLACCCCSSWRSPGWPPCSAWSPGASKRPTASPS